MILALLFACSEPAPVVEAPVAPPAPAAEPAAPPADLVHLGEPVDSTTVVSIDTVVAAATEWNGKDLVVEGVIKEVCQKKGCWHTVATADPNVAVMVKDKEYKIFLPKDSAGKKVHLKGNFAMVETPEDEAKHYAEDAGRDPSTIVGPQKGFAIDVSGVKFIES
jgi:hypothetical protein